MHFIKKTNVFQILSFENFLEYERGCNSRSWKPPFQETWLTYSYYKMVSAFPPQDWSFKHNNTGRSAENSTNKNISLFELSLRRPAYRNWTLMIVFLLCVVMSVLFVFQPIPSLNKIMNLVSLQELDVQVSPTAGFTAWFRN